MRLKSKQAPEEYLRASVLSGMRGRPRAFTERSAAAHRRQQDDDEVASPRPARLPKRVIWHHFARYLGGGRDRTGRKNVTLMVQAPSTFDASRACIVRAHSSGSRGVYGAIGASGEWRLKDGCAIAYNDKGWGQRLHDLETDIVGLIPICLRSPLRPESVDFALDGAICHRNLVEGRDIVTGAALTGAMHSASLRVRRGIEAVKLRGFLKNIPSIVVAGREDALVPVNHSSPACCAKNQAT